MSDSSLPPDPAGELPDLERAFEAAGGMPPELDPVILLSDLVAENGAAMNELTQQGVNLTDAHTLISSLLVQEFLETILRAVAGEEAVVQAGIRVHRAIGPMLAQAKSQVAMAKLAAPGPVPPIHPNRAARRG